MVVVNEHYSKGQQAVHSHIWQSSSWL